MTRFIITLLLFSCCKLYLNAQIVPPIDISLYLSGNFAELRTNHFHSGIDFKIQGKIGEPIKSIDDGYVSRISVSPTGYGRALYINHPNGTTSVYGHLDHFEKKIETFATDSQYIKQSFRLDLNLSPDILVVKKGEVIGYGGNTGSSGGPHLHFEIRNTDTEEVLDPLPMFMTKIEDTTKPRIQGLMIYPQPGKGIVNGETGKLKIQLKKDKAGKETILPEIKAWGDIAFAVNAYDYMDGSPNTQGVKRIKLAVDDKEIFSSEINRFAFNETRYLNSFVDWEEWTYHNSFYMKSFIDPGNLLNVYTSENKGIIRINEEKEYKITYTLNDIYGNTTVFNFNVTGQKQEIPEYKPRGTFYSHNRNNQILLDGVEITIPKGNLYNDIYFTYSVKKNYTPYSALHNLNKRTPLHSYCPLVITIENDVLKEKEKYGIISVEGKRVLWVGGKYENGKIQAKVRELGSYTVSADTTAPVITEVNPTYWKKNKKIAFKVRDNLSGISNWSATLNDNFVAFELDAKKNDLFCTFDSHRMKAGKQTLVLWVEDACGNRKIYEKEINW